MTEPCKCSRETELGIMRVQQENSNQTVREIKDIIKTIENSVGVIRVIELESEQQAREFAKLVSTVNDLNKMLPTLTDDLEQRIDVTKSALEAKLSSVSTVNDAREVEWKTKYSKLQGIVIGISSVFFLVSIVLGTVIRDQSAKIEQSHNYTMQLKTVDALEKLKKGN